MVESSGMILVSGVVDREFRDRFEFNIQVKDRGYPSLSDTAKVLVLVGDVNEHPPEFVDYYELLPAVDGSPITTPLYRASVIESAATGSIITKVQAKD
ncbi:UNVERIFIED_CONTAM: hypothetical protein GTU68_000609, partial [Idotea baltica]|nr:hypothetical protein [Idotea baltica]